MAETLPQFLYENFRKYGSGKTAYRYKDLGVWKPTTWSEYFARVKYFAMGLLSLGLKKDNKIGVVGSNRAECFIAMLAAQSVQGVSVALFSDSIDKEIAYQLSLSESVFVVAEDQEQVDKILAQEDKLPQIRRIIYFEPKGLWNYKNAKIISWKDVERIGKEYDAANPDLFMDLVKKGGTDDMALICWTSGSTGAPKAVMISHGNLVSSIKAFSKAAPLYDTDDYLSMLPIGWMGELIFGLAGSIIIGYRVNFPESTDVVMENFREVGPTISILTVPALNSIVNNIQFKIMETSPLKRWVYQKAISCSLLYINLKIKKERINMGLKVLKGLFYLACISRMRELIGLSRLRVILTGGAGLGPDVFKFVHSLGVPLRIVYGQSENSAFCTVQHSGDINPDSVGRPLDKVEVRISDDGEILSRGDTIFMGYYKDPENTRKTIDEEGWLHSGDAGEWLSDGELVVIDRVKDLMTLNNGTNFSPLYIENKLKFSPFIKEAVVFGNHQEYIVVLINIDLNVVGKWCEKRNIAYTTYSDISSNKQVGDLITLTVQEINENLPSSSRVEKFVLLPKELDADDDELTRTKKVRRDFIANRYQVVVDALFSDKRDVYLDLEIKYQDGRISNLATDIKLHYPKV
jgi:long-chain acyl-CoA synthetase